MFLKGVKMKTFKRIMWLLLLILILIVSGYFIFTAVAL